MSKMATQTFCRNLGGKGSSGNKLVISSELTSYGCRLKSGKSYSSNQCVQESDIEKAATQINLTIQFQTDDYSLFCWFKASQAVPTSLKIDIEYYSYNGTFTEDLSFTMDSGRTESIVKHIYGSQSDLNGAFRKGVVTPESYLDYQFVLLY